MGFNVINAAVSGAEGFLQSGGNPGAAIAMGVAGGLSPGSGATVAGTLGNGALGVMDAQQEAFQVAMYGEQIRGFKGLIDFAFIPSLSTRKTCRALPTFAA